MLMRLFRIIKRKRAARSNDAALKRAQAALSARFPEASERDLERLQWATFNRFRMLKSGITRYRWSTCGDERRCAFCRERAGKAFDLKPDPEGSYPGAFICCNGKPCRCTMSPLFEGIDY